jgi:selenide,water dikinase
MARGADLDAQIHWSAVPLLAGVQALAQQGFITGASGRNWAGYGAEVVLPEGFSPLDQALLSDPQTSGGLLVSCAPDALEAVMAVFKQHGFEDATVVGSLATKQIEQVRLRVN